MLTISATDTTLIIKLETDRLEAANVATFKSLLSELPSVKERKVLIHLKPVCFIDSSGIGALLSLLMKLNPKDGQLFIREAQPQVANVIRMLRLEKALVIEEA